VQFASGPWEHTIPQVRAAFAKAFKMENASDAELAHVWSAMDADDLEGVLGHANFTVKTGDIWYGRPYPFSRQSPEIQRQFKESYEDAHESRNGMDIDDDEGMTKAGKKYGPMVKAHEKECGQCRNAGVIDRMCEIGKDLVLKQSGFRNAFKPGCGCGHQYDDHHPGEGGTFPCGLCKCASYHKRPGEELDLSKRNDADPLERKNAGVRAGAAKYGSRSNDIMSGVKWLYIRKSFGSEPWSIMGSEGSNMDWATGFKFTTEAEAAAAAKKMAASQGVPYKGVQE